MGLPEAKSYIYTCLQRRQTRQHVYFIRVRQVFLLYFTHQIVPTAASFANRPEHGFVVSHHDAARAVSAIGPLLQHSAQPTWFSFEEFVSRSRGSQKTACRPTTPSYLEVNEPPKASSGEVLDAGQRDLPEKHKSARHCDGAEFIYIRLNEQPLMDCSPGCR